MSLINQMLQDLEKRNAATGKSAPLSGEVRAVPEPETMSPLVWLVTALVLLAAMAGAAWMYLHKHADTPAVAVASPGPAAPVATLQSPVAVPAGDDPSASAAVSDARAPGLEKGLQAAPPVQPIPAAPMRQVPPALAADAPASSADAVLPPRETAARQNPAPKIAAVQVGGTIKTISPVQQSDNLYRQAVATLQQGRVAEAQESLRKSLELNPNNIGARQVLVGLTVEAGHNDEAMSLLREGLRLSPEQTGYSMALARLQVESGGAGGAVATLQQGLQYAGDNAEYHGFYAALLQREERHDEAVQHYLTALRSDPAMPTWLIGIGISLQALGQDADAIAAFQRAKDTGQLNAQLGQFADQRLLQLKR